MWADCSQCNNLHAPCEPHGNLVQLTPMQCTHKGRAPCIAPSVSTYSTAAPLPVCMSRKLQGKFITVQFCKVRYADENGNTHADRALPLHPQHRVQRGPAYLLFNIGNSNQQLSKVTSMHWVQHVPAQVITIASPALVLAPRPAFLTTVAKAPPNSAFFQPAGIGVCIVPPPGIGVFSTLCLPLAFPAGWA